MPLRGRRQYKWAAVAAYGVSGYAWQVFTVKRVRWRMGLASAMIGCAVALPELSRVLVPYWLNALRAILARRWG